MATYLEGLARTSLAAAADGRLVGVSAADVGDILASVGLPAAAGTLSKKTKRLTIFLALFSSIYSVARLE